MTRGFGLYTDLYELRMVESYLKRGMTDEATFSLYIRPTAERPWFVSLGAERVVQLLETFGYTADDLDYLQTLDVDERTLSWLRDVRVAAELWAPREGTVVLANEPLLEISGPLPILQLLETAVINLVQYPVLIATKAARIAIAARGRPVADFGFRRAHGLETGVDAALLAHIGGGLLTSNVEAGRRFKIPVVGTMAHAFVQAFDREIDAFRAFARDHPTDCVLLVDTYDTVQGVLNAISVAHEMRDAGQELRGIRLDSGDLRELARRARDLLDDAGLEDVTILASGGLDEVDIARLVADGAPIDAFGVGTDLVVSADRPALDIAYKLVEYGGRAVAKHSEGKRSYPGRKQVFRRGSPEGDVLGLRDEALDGERLLEPVWRNGERLATFDLVATREHVTAGIEALPERWKDVADPPSPPVPRIGPALRELSH